MDTRTARTTGADAAEVDGLTSSPPILLAELHPDTLLPADGLSLLATCANAATPDVSPTHSARSSRARMAGFRYLQHTVIVHGHAVGASLWLGHKSIKTTVDIVPIEQLHTAAESAVLERPDKC